MRNSKSEARNPKQIPRTEVQNSKQYDLEERTFRFAKGVRGFVQKLPKTISNLEDGKQLVKASGSVGGNYIEANEALSKKDFVMRIKICRKEALEKEQKYFQAEATELMNIFGAILRKSQ